MIRGCKRCEDTGWICKAHPERPWDGGAAKNPCKCGAPGMPCPLCNPYGRPDDPPDVSRTGVRRQHEPSLQGGSTLRVADMKARQSAKVGELREALVAAELRALDEQAQVLGLARSSGAQQKLLAASAMALVVPARDANEVTNFWKR